MENHEIANLNSWFVSTKKQEAQDKDYGIVYRETSGVPDETELHFRIPPRTKSTNIGYTELEA